MNADVKTQTIPAWFNDPRRENLHEMLRSQVKQYEARDHPKVQEFLTKLIDLINDPEDGPKAFTWVYGFRAWADKAQTL